jgi:hypothetical protein
MEAVQDAGLEQEVVDVVGQMGKHVFTQVIGDEALAATDDERIRPREMALEVQRHQLQAGVPVESSSR